MNTKIKKIVGFFRQHKYVQLVLILVIIVLLVLIIPRVYVPKPVITGVVSTNKEDEKNHITGQMVTIQGKKLDNTVAVYVNNQWNKDCIIVSNASDAVLVRLPEYYIQDSETAYTIQLQTKANGEYFSKSNKYTIYVRKE